MRCTSTGGVLPLLLQLYLAACWHGHPTVRQLGSLHAQEHDSCGYVAPLKPGVEVRLCFPAAGRLRPGQSPAASKLLPVLSSGTSPCCCKAAACAEQWHLPRAAGQIAFVAGGVAAAGGSVVKVPLAVCIRSVQAGVYPNVIQACGIIVKNVGVKGLFTVSGAAGATASACEGDAWMTSLSGGAGRGWEAHEPWSVTL